VLPVVSATVTEFAAAEMSTVPKTPTDGTL
jgi:hypothetical protein